MVEKQCVVLTPEDKFLVMKISFKLYYTICVTDKNYGEGLESPKRAYGSKNDTFSESTTSR